ncbi:MAG: DNA double-strand break repair nuclease NurA [Candidatus Aenigmarchaeota archaeon]|nr:DNA double-strand break repair nuclease NurA [Candidatus Aenigmarchaeota archaeon]
MEHAHARIREVSERITSAESGRRKLAAFLRKADAGSRLARKVAMALPDGIKIAGVDGGIVKRSLHGFDLVMARATGVCFTYENGKVKKAEYHPERMPEPELFVLEALNELDWVHSASIIRQKLEIRNALETAEKFRPALLLLDGSIVPHYSDRPAKNSKVRESFDELISLYNKLFSFCSENGIMLAGVVEDSRGTRFCELAGETLASDGQNEWARNALVNARDTSLLFWMLEDGERTFAFQYSDIDESGEHPLAKEFGSFASRIFTFYLKTAKFDRPVRVDFIGNESNADTFASKILAISSHHSGYGFPSVLIEADQSAKMEENAIESICDQISAASGVMRLRRDSRPF